MSLSFDSVGDIRFDGIDGINEPRKTYTVSGDDDVIDGICLSNGWKRLKAPIYLIHDKAAKSIEYVLNGQLVFYQADKFEDDFTSWYMCIISICGQKGKIGHTCSDEYCRDTVERRFDDPDLHNCEEAPDPLRFIYSLTRDYVSELHAWALDREKDTRSLARMTGTPERIKIAAELLGEREDEY